MSEEKFVYTACPGWGDHDFCALKTVVKDGVIDHCEKIEYSEPEKLDGHICQKGCLAHRIVDNPNRVLHPLKRIGKRGEGEWEQISWDQALDEIAAKLNQIRDESGPQSVCMWHLGAGMPPAMGFEDSMPKRFANTFGCTDPMTSQGLDCGPFYSEFYLTNDAFLHTIIDPACWANCDGDIWIWGCNPIENQMRAAQNVVRAREAGANIIDIGLVFDGSAGYADEFYGVKPGSDGWLAAFIMRRMFETDSIDKEYVLSRSSAAYLVDEETGKLARDASGASFYVYDSDAQGLAAIAGGRAEYPCANPALFGRFEIDGKSYATSLTLLQESCDQYTLQKTIEMTGLSGDQINYLADKWCDLSRNEFILSGYGLRYPNANETCRFFHYIGILSGRLGKPNNGVVESLQLMSYPVMLNDAAIVCPEGPQNVKGVSMRQSDWFELAQSDKSPFRALLVAGGNPVHQFPDRKRWLEIVKRMELVVDVDIWITDTGELADYILPDCTPFEREDVVLMGVYNHIVLQEPAIERIGDTKDPVELWSELGKRVGLEKYFNLTLEDYMNIRFDFDWYPLVCTIEPKVTYERLKKEKMIRLNAPAEPKFDPWMDPFEVYATPTGRLELYAERLSDLDDAVPQPRGLHKIGKSEEYPYQLFTGRQRFFMQSSYTDDPITIHLSGDKPATRVNPIDAKRHGLQAGDKVEVYNDRGHVVTNLEISESIPAGTIHVWFGWRRRQFEEGTYSEMVNQASGRDTVTELEDRWWNDWIATGRTGSVLAGDAASQPIGAADCYWDSWCNIRKYEVKKEA